MIKANSLQTGSGENDKTGFIFVPPILSLILYLLNHIFTGNDKKLICHVLFHLQDLCTVNTPHF